MKKLIFLLLLSLCAQNVFADAQKYNLNESKKIEGYISKDEMNRIKIEGDRISEVVGLSEGFLLESDEKLGQIFIKVDKISSDQNAVFTVITEKGKSQDFKLSVSSKTSGQIILVEDNELTDDKKILGKKHVRHDEMVSLMRLVRNFQPNINEQKPYMLKNSLKVIPLVRKKIGDCTVEIWNLQNILPETTTFVEKQFVSSNTAAVMLENKVLNAGKTTKLYRVLYD